MKAKYYQLPILFTLLISLVSCEDLLENSVETNLRPEQVYVNYERMREVAVGAYTHLSLVSGFYQCGASLMACVTDEAEETDYSSPAQKINLGTWNPYSNPDDKYDKFYTAIRHCNVFLENSVDYKKILVTDTITSMGKATYIHRCEDIAFFRNEVRFLRSFYYFELIKRYGGVPLLTKTVVEQEARLIARSSFNECVNFIVKECDDIKDNMQVDWEAAELPEDDGRATKGAVLALKSRVLLYAASPLNNPTNDTQKWIDAAKAAHEVMAMKKVGSSIKQMYQLSSNYQTLFLAPNSYLDAEVIMYIRHANSNVLEAWNYPVGTPGGRSGVSPTQNLVDAYDHLAGWNAADPYKKIDPRMQYTIAVNGSEWNGRILECYVGGRDGVDQRGASRTGYYLKKFLSPNLNLVSITPGRSMKAWILFRYGEILLNYAEAMNEAFGPNVTSLANGLTLYTSRTALNQLRQRDGIKIPNIPNKTQDELRKLIKKERQVELAFEEHRAWDLRRWNDGVILSNPIEGMLIEKKDNDYLYTRRTIESRVFEEKMYLYPLPQSEINKYPDVLKQNKGW